MSDIVEVGEQQNGKQIEVIRGQTLRVTLPEVRTAGFRWSLRTSSQQILTPLAGDVNANSETAGGAAQHHASRCRATVTSLVTRSELR